MDYMEIIGMADNIINIAEATTNLTDRYIDKAMNFDERYLDSRYWMRSPKGIKTNGWIQLYDLDLFTGYDDVFDATSNSFKRLGNQINSYSTDKKEYANVVLNNVNVNISRSPTIIETRIKGLNNSIKQFWSNNDYDINITGKITGPFFWQHDSKTIQALLSLLNSGKALGIACPELDLLGYNIQAVVVYNYNLSQDSRFYQSKVFSMQLKSDNPTISISNDGGKITNY